MSPPDCWAAMTLSQDTALQGGSHSRCVTTLPLMLLSYSAITSGANRQHRLA